MSTSGSRSAVAQQSGAKTQVAGLTAAVAVLVMLVLVPGLVQDMPQPVLAAVVIAASISLFDLPELRRLAGLARGEFWLAVACALSVALIGVLPGHRRGDRAVGRLDLQAAVAALLRDPGQGPGQARLA